MNLSPQVSGIKHASQIVVLLDAEARVLNVNNSRAGKSFSLMSDTAGISVHEQLHPSCNGECRFSDLWKKAWATLDTRDSIEWEIEDRRLARMLRLNLTVPPQDPEVEIDRFERRTLLTITDITKYRNDYVSLVEREQKQAKLLHEQGVDASTYPDNSGRYRSFGRQVIRAQEDERRRIASDLHDGIAQTLGAAKYQIEAAVDALQKQDPDLDLDMFDDVVSSLKGAVDEVRRISSNLAPSMLDDFGICVALDWLCNEWQKSAPGISVHCAICVDECDMPDLVKIAAYRVAQEALSNSSRHASASSISVSLESGSDGVKLTVVDNGSGFDHGRTADLPQRTGGQGLRNMQERVAATGGQFTIESEIPTGTIVRAYWDKEAVELLANESVLDSVDGNG